MKKISKIITVFMSFIVTVSCSEDFIDLDPISSVSTNILYQTDKDFNDALVGVYDVFQDLGRYYIYFGDLRAEDSADDVVKPGSDSYMDQFTTNPQDGLMNTTWRESYKAIYLINTILTKIEEADASVIVNKAQYVGEAKFFRALAYFDLVRLFGDVPLVTTPLTIEEGYQTTRTPVTAIYNELIIPDLLTAANNLPISYSASNVGRPTTGAAKAILGRVYLTLNDYTKAETVLQEVTTLGYELLPDFNDLWDWDNKHHEEYIFDIEYAAGVGEGNSFTQACAPNSIEFREFYNLFGEGGELHCPTSYLFDLFDTSPGDLRRDVTIGTRGGFYGKDSVWILLPTNTSQSYTKKYICNSAATSDAYANWPVVRYGDVLLMYAEALNENGKTSQAITYLNQIRARADVAEYPLTLSQSEIHDAIEKERRLELSFEGVRWFDLLRYGKAYDVCQPLGMLPHMTLFPLPLSQVELINDASIFPQNPGY